ncbi:DUF1028 domain-containing protein [Adhaeribacter pallidiroseus]|uniref:DUF1028 domain-containing protein n=1 Tax=Adhaeribacter pallidiroseus TaxID=2072847 RepID=A0A369QNX2_9BACT|nr:DUF1028 domain-containing protein [Adhaeribacter pallidiroseus]RDC65385.1 hypothetical protein AHMF7616_04015 [Adhaeribacter pallidiroseus]
MVSFLLKFSLTAGLVFLGHLPLFATWSIIVIDPVTKEIGIAGASCSYNCYGIGAIIPGKGAVIVQARSSNSARKKGLKMLEANATPEQIIAEMRNPKYNPEQQQYAVISIRNMAHPKTYTGQATAAYNGALTASGVSVQGNTLAHENQLKIILEAVLKAQKERRSISDVLMIALEAGSAAGGDKRCGAQKATSAFIMVTKPDDYLNDPYLNLTIYGLTPGKENAVKLLRAKYEQWIKE